MPKRPQVRPRLIFDPAKYRGPKPGDFPVGSVQSRSAARAIVESFKEEARETEAKILAFLPPGAEVLIEDCDDPLVRICTLRLILGAQEHLKEYGQTLCAPVLEKIGHRQAIHEEIDRMTGGQSSSIQKNNAAEWHRLEGIAEENLRAKKN